MEPQSAPRKGLSPLAWIAIGCGAIVVCGILVISLGGFFVAKKVSQFSDDFEQNPARSAAELAVKLNPDLELVESDSEAGTITVRRKDTGEQMTFDYQQIKEGKLAITSPGGETVRFDLEANGEEGGALVVEGPEGQVARFGSGGTLPDWIPQPPGAQEVQPAILGTQQGQTSGTAMASSSATIDELVAFYQGEMTGLGLDVETSDVTTAQGRTVVVVGNAADRSLTATLADAGGSRSVNLMFHGPAE